MVVYQKDKFAQSVGKGFFFFAFWEMNIFNKDKIVSFIFFSNLHNCWNQKTPYDTHLISFYQWSKIFHLLFSFQNCNRYIFSPFLIFLWIQIDFFPKNSETSLTCWPVEISLCIKKKKKDLIFISFVFTGDHWLLCVLS